MNRAATGKTGEELAVKFLLQAGMQILARNYRIQRGEIDIIAREDEVVVFVEVKTCRSNAFGPPETWVTPHKCRQIGRVAREYIYRHGLYEQNCRFDVVSVYLKKSGPEIHHIVNAFWIDPEEPYAKF
jgi:putative endonuclease